MPWALLLGTVTCFALVGLLLYLPMRMAGLYPKT